MSFYKIFTIIFYSNYILSRAQFNEKCSEAEFTCDDGSCLNKEYVCDGRTQCPDGSDEDFVTCRLKSCRDDQFKCVYGACVSKHAVCNGVKDCADNSDELVMKCQKKNRYLPCLFEGVINNFRKLKSFEKTCRNEETTCNNGERILLGQKCDGTVHCRDGSDETLETCASSLCSLWTHELFRCKYGGCNVYIKQCDGIKDCPDGSDELEKLCRSNFTTVASRRCILPRFPKNGYFEFRKNASTLNYSCYPGYRLIGARSSSCYEGSWTEETPRCVADCQLIKHPSVEYLCLSSNSHLNANLVECDKTVGNGTVVRPKCREPHYYHSGVLSHMQCIEGVWDHIAVCTPQCGQVTSEISTMAVGGKPARRGGIPWHAGIYQKIQQLHALKCGGSLVSKHVVITAAHCFWSNVVNRILNETNFAVALGKLYRRWQEDLDDEVQKSDVQEIKIPPRYQGAYAHFQDDIALVMLKSTIEFNNFVRPVCLDFDFNFSRQQLYSGAMGKVAGWGLTDENNERSWSKILQVVELPYVDVVHCIAGLSEIFRGMITSDKICAGFNNGTTRTVCRGDSGGGLVFKASERSTERYYLRGVVSTAPSINEQACNVQSYVAFTFVDRHADFINDNLNH